METGISAFAGLPGDGAPDGADFGGCRPGPAADHGAADADAAIRSKVDNSGTCGSIVRNGGRLAAAGLRARQHQRRDARF